MLQRFEVKVDVEFRPIQMSLVQQLDFIGITDPRLGEPWILLEWKVVLGVTHEQP